MTPATPVRRPPTRRLAASFAPLVLALCASAPSPPALAAAGEGGFDRAALEAWAHAHGGGAAARTYVYQGSVFDVPGGKRLGSVDGWQIARTFPGGAADPQAWYVVRRAFLLYRSPDGGEILERYPDVRASRAPVPVLSIVRFALQGDRVVTRGVAGVRGATREVVLPEQLAATREDDAWVFLRVLTPGDPQQKPVELTELVARDGGSDAEPRVRFVMTKVAENWGFLPAGGRHVLHLTWRPVASLQDVAPVVRELVTKQAPPGLATLPPTLDAAFAELGLERQSIAQDSGRR